MYITTPFIKLQYQSYNIVIHLILISISVFDLIIFKNKNQYIF